MKIIICLDEENGYMFNHRRQSMDRQLRQHLLTLLDGRPLWMSEYTKRQFTEDGNYVVDDEYEKKCGDDDFCFIEDKGYSVDKCNEMWIFRWDKKYPRDKVFDVDLLKEGFVQRVSEVFPGYSHEKIMFEKYEK